MEAAGRLRLADVFVSIHDPRQSAKVKHDLLELLVVAVNAVLVGADTFAEIELWAEEKLEWLRGYLQLPHGIPSHDTFGRIFGLIDPEQFESAFRRWVSSILPALGAEIVAIDGKTRGPRRQVFVAGVEDQPPLGWDRRHGTAPGFGLCRRGRPGAGAAGYCREVQRNHGHS